MGALDDLLASKPSGGGGSSSLDALLSAPPKSRTWSQTFEEAGQNLPQSALNATIGYARAVVPGGLAGPVAQMMQNPKETARGLASHYGKYFSDEGRKELIATDPVGTAAEVATLFAPGPKGASALRAAESAAPKIASVAELKAGGGAALNVARESGVYFTPDFVKPLKDTLIDVADQGGFRPGRTGTAELGNIMKDVDAMSARPWSFRDIHELEQDLNDVWLTAKKSGRNTVSGIAGRQRGVVRQFLDKVEQGNTEGIYATADLTPQRATQLHQEGLKIYRSAKAGEKAEQMKALAENDRTLFTTAGVAHSIKKQARQILSQHAKGKPTGLNARELETVKSLRDGTISDWVLQGARKFGGTVGAMVGAQLGGPVGAGVTYMIGKGAGTVADKLAMQRLNRFIETIREDGSSRLQSLLGEAVHSHLMGTPKGKASIENWRSKLGTKGGRVAARSLAVLIGQMTKRSDLTPRIASEIEGLEQPAQ